MNTQEIINQLTQDPLFIKLVEKYSKPVDEVQQQSIERFIINGVPFNMIKVESGSFKMGFNGKEACTEENPVHDVTLSSYYIGETQVTQELWEVVMGSNPSNFKGSKRPVENVSWNDCQEFICKLNAVTGKSFRLPTEAEWEYAARGGNKGKGYKYAGSDSIETVAWYDENSYDKGSVSLDYGTHDVATKKSNELGLYDMSGNVWEWCSDWWGKSCNEAYYGDFPQTNPKGPENGFSHVCRGGSWLNHKNNCRVMVRLGYGPSSHNNNLGLRLALNDYFMV